MTQLTLRGCSILVVEDEYLLAEELCAALAAETVQVIGPAATVAQGAAALRETPRLNGAILDVNLRGEEVFELADMMAEQGIPFLFTTGYDVSMIPNRFADVARFEKPLSMSDVVRTIGRMSHEIEDSGT